MIQDPSSATGRRPGIRARGFTLVEALITIAIIGVMAAGVISAFSNAAEDSRRVMARQQQAVVQGAVNNWVTSRLQGTATIAQVRDLYNNKAPSTPRSSLERMQLIAGYLDEATVADLASYGNADQIRSQVLADTNQYLELPTWQNGSYPKVNLQP